LSNVLLEGLLSLCLLRVLLNTLHFCFAACGSSAQLSCCLVGQWESLRIEVATGQDSWKFQV
jgi:hypothetical protein